MLVMLNRGMTGTRREEKNRGFKNCSVMMVQKELRMMIMKMRRLKKDVGEGNKTTKKVRIENENKKEGKQRYEC